MDVVEPKGTEKLNELEKTGGNCRKNAGGRRGDGDGTKVEETECGSEGGITGDVSSG